MNYEFPFITCIEDILPAIEGREEFSVVENKDYTLIRYENILEDTFPQVFTPMRSDMMGNVYGHYEKDFALRRECRGIIFDTKTGKLLRRPFHKFFNYGEKPESHNVELDQPHMILEKLDGSMIAPFLLGRELLWGTKSGHDTDVAWQAAAHVTKMYENFARKQISLNACTPIFEWCSPRNKIVLDYPNEGLVLTGIRHMTTGMYFTYDEMLKEAKQYNIPIVEYYQTNGNMQQLSQYVHEGTEMEGVVVVFGSGHRLKIKSEWYVNLHRAKEAMTWDRNIVQYILEGTLDDIKPYMTDDDLVRLNEFEGLVNSQMNEYASRALDLVTAAKTSITKKEFATETVTQFDPFTKSLVLSLWDEPSRERAYNSVKRIVAKNLFRNVKYAELRDTWFKGVKYNEM